MKKIKFKIGNILHELPVDESVYSAFMTSRERINMENFLCFYITRELRLTKNELFSNVELLEGEDEQHLKRVFVLEHPENYLDGEYVNEIKSNKPCRERE